jgi:hypothetical protein
MVEIFGINALNVGYTGGDNGAIYFVTAEQTTNSVPELIAIFSSRDMTDATYWNDGSSGVTCTAGLDPMVGLAHLNSKVHLQARSSIRVSPSLTTPMFIT